MINHKTKMTLIILVSLAQPLQISADVLGLLQHFQISPNIPAQVTTQIPVTTKIPMLIKVGGVFAAVAIAAAAYRYYFGRPGQGQSSKPQPTAPYQNSSPFSSDKSSSSSSSDRSSSSSKSKPCEPQAPVVTSPYDGGQEALNEWRSVGCI